jgi:hypothetical protein
MAAAARTAATPGRHPTRSALAEIGRDFVADYAGEGLVRLLPADLAVKMASAMPDSLLTDGDVRKDWSRGLVAAFALFGLEPKYCHAIATFFEQGTEEVGKRMDKMDGKGGDADRKVIREAMGSKKALLEPLREKKEGADAQKKSMPDYFTAKAAIKDEKLREKLSEIERALKDDKYVELRKLLPNIELALKSGTPGDIRKALTDIKLKLEQTKRVRLHEKLPAIELALKSDKDDDRRKVLSDIELVLKDDEYDPDAFRRFLRRGAYRIKTTPDELTEIAKASMIDIMYGVERLKGLMAGERGEGGVTSKLKKLGEDLLDDVFQGDGTGTAAERLNAKVTASRALVQAATARNRRVD